MNESAEPQPFTHPEGSAWHGDLHLILPMKSISQAKSRLDLPSPLRCEVVTRLVAHTLDVAAACLPANRVTVVTSDERMQRSAGARGMDVLADPATGLNGAIDAAMGRVRRVTPSAVRVALVNDLPALRVRDLQLVLNRVANSWKVRHVPDLRGTGTTVLAVPADVDFPALFGPDSARRFLRAGSVPLDEAPLSVRADLDTLSDLDRLWGLGVSRDHIEWLLPFLREQEGASR